MKLGRDGEARGGREGGPQPRRGSWAGHAVTHRHGHRPTEKRGQREEAHAQAGRRGDRRHRPAGPSSLPTPRHPSALRCLSLQPRLSPACTPTPGDAGLTSLSATAGVKDPEERAPAVLRAPRAVMGKVRNPAQEERFPGPERPRVVRPEIYTKSPLNSTPFKAPALPTAGRHGHLGRTRFPTEGPPGFWEQNGQGAPGVPASSDPSRKNAENPRALENPTRNLLSLSKLRAPLSEAVPPSACDSDPAHPRNPRRAPAGSSRNGECRLSL